MASDFQWFLEDVAGVAQDVVASLNGTLVDGSHGCQARGLHYSTSQHGNEVRWVVDEGVASTIRRRTRA